MARMIFDLDGVLVDTREANLRAYRSCDIQPPEDFHVRPWQEWTNKQDHDRKNAALDSFVHLMKPLPLLDLVGPDTVVLSNCSPHALYLVRRTFSKLKYTEIYAGLDAFHKAAWLLDHTNEKHPAGVYFDDSAVTLRVIKAHTGWQTCLVS